MTGQPHTPPRSPKPACQACGYSLEGFDASSSTRVCPECGEPFDPSNPWLPLPWPASVIIWLRLCAPTLMLLTLILGVFACRPLRNMLGWPTWPVWIALLCFVVFWPLSAAGSLAATREPRTMQRAAAGRRSIPALVFNVAAIVAAILALRFMV
ncbi:MAG: hypothetical protein AABZ53_13150 [Planctomycetota bacterium]